MLKQILLLVFLSLGSLQAGVTSLSLTTDLGAPGGDLTALPGQITGWGFTFLNLTDYALLTSATYIHTGGTVAGADLADFIGPQGIVVGPAPESTSFTQGFLLALLQGTHSFQVSPGAAPGTSSSGYVQVTYDLFAVSPNDPLFDPTTDQLSVGNFVVAPASITITAPPPGVPEPGSFSLVATALLAGCAFAARRFRR